jgi:hypothetical protein
METHTRVFIGDDFVKYRGTTVLAFADMFYILERRVSKVLYTVALWRRPPVGN